MADTGQKTGASAGFEVDAELEKQILQNVGPIIGSASVGLLVAGIGALLMYLGINMKSSTMKGDSNIQPTKDDVSVSQVEATAKDTDASMAKDELTAKDGDLSAAKTDAAASDGEATALESGASAARTKAGAADVETKGLKMT